MANPQPTDAHLRVAHEISEQLMVSHFTAQQRRILDLILRLSWGCGKKYAVIPHQRDFELIGILEGHVKRELDLLIRDGIITRDGDKYSFCKDYDKWRVSRSRAYTPEKLTDLVSLNLNNGRKTYRICKSELTEYVSSPDTNSATAKESIKERKKYIKKEFKTEAEILDYLNSDPAFMGKLRKENPDLRFDDEVQQFALRAAERYTLTGEAISTPKSSLRNWLRKAREFGRVRKWEEV